MKNILSVLMVIVVFAIVGAFILYFNNSENNTSSTTEVDKDYSFILNEKATDLPEYFADNQKQACEISSRYYEYLCKNKKISIKEKNYSVNGIYAEDFPDFFAGTFINTDGKLVIQVTEKYYSKDYRNSDWYKELVEVVQSEDFACNPVKYSYCSIVNAMTDLLWGDFSKKLSEENVKITASWIDDYRNCVFIGVKDDIDYNKVLKMIDSSIYKVVVENVTISEDVGLYPGGDITKASYGGSFFSMACRARRYDTINGTYEYGMLTAGHAFSGTSNVYINTGGTSNIYIGYSPYYLQKNSGSVDAAFISTTSNMDLYNTVFMETTTLYSTCFVSVNIGTVIYKRGTTTQTTVGLVTSGSYNFSRDNIAFTDFIKSTYYSQIGDSGGIVYTAPDSTNHAYPIGIHSGHGDTTNQSEQYSICCKISNALNGLQIPFVSIYLY